MESDIGSQVQQVHTDNLRALLCEASVVQANQYFECETVKLIHHPTDHSLGQVLKTRIVMSLLSSPELRIVVKVHFNLEQVRRYCQMSKWAYLSQSDRQLIDFMKEFCNQFGGRVCRILEVCQISMGMSIPLCTRGIYELHADYSPQASGIAKFGEFWGLDGPFEMLYCSCYIELVSQTCLSGVKYSDEQSQEGELDFL